MPFTPAHAAAALPLLRTRLPASALVIGTLAPDLPYYTPVGTSADTHSAAALVTTDLAIGAAAWLLWHALLAPAAVAASPGPLRARVAGRVVTGVRRRLLTRADALRVVAALVVGAATHVAWDELSHPGRWGTEHLAVLREPFGPLEGYRWVQYGSGVLGLAVLGVWALLWWRRTQPATPTAGTGVVAPLGRRTTWVWLALLVVAAVAGCAAAALAPDLRSAAFAGATVGGGAALAAGAVGALVWRLRPSGPPASAPPGAG